MGIKIMTTYKTSFKSILIIFVVFFNLINAAKKVDKCESCNNLVKNLIKKLDKTSKGNFGGGNTDWEDRKLGNYLYSETRFEEVLENICEDDSECNSAIEEHEDYLFDWFKNKQKSIKSELYSHLCIKTMKTCCPTDSYGPKCEKCPQNLNKTCTGNGKCDGDGTRKGNGKCKCNDGFGGDMCEKCKAGYFQIETQNDNTLKCIECHKACKSTCFKDGPDGCVDCNEGWLFNEGKCEDIDECKQSGICNTREYCLNNDGAYSCLTCNAACKTCTSSGPNNCIDCSEGYEKDSDNVCVDINECHRNPGVCGVDECLNTIGSYECKVITNIEEKNDQLDEHELESKTAATNSDEQINNNSKESSKAEL